METIIGRLTKDAVVKTFESGKAVVNFDIAQTDTYRTKTGEKKVDTRFIRCAYWANTGVAPYLRKGGLVEIEGRMNVDAYIGKDNNAVGVLTMNVRKITLHGAKGGNQTLQPAMATVTVAPSTTEPADDLPF